MSWRYSDVCCIEAKHSLLTLLMLYVLKFSYEVYKYIYNLYNPSTQTWRRLLESKKQELTYAI